MLARNLFNEHDKGSNLLGIVHFGIRQRSVRKRKESMLLLSQKRRILLYGLMRDPGPSIK